MNNNTLSVQKLFDNTANKYDFLNDLLSFGIHRIWKRQVIFYLQPRPGQNWIDLCCGTGDMSFELAQQVRSDGRVLGVDFSQESLKIACSRHQKLPWLNINWLHIDVMNTGLDSNSLDGAVMAYGLRNLQSYLKGLIEIHRILKPGAKAALLDFNKCKKDSFSYNFQKYYLRKYVVYVANRLGLRQEYEYIEDSIEKFPDGKEQEQLSLEAGFSSATHKIIAGGQMGILLLQV